MRKIWLLMLIALFSYGNLCEAQDKNTRFYWARGMSAYDADGVQHDNDGVYERDYLVSATFDGDTILFKGLLGLSGREGIAVENPLNAYIHRKDPEDNYDMTYLYLPAGPSRWINYGTKKDDVEQIAAEGTIGGENYYMPLYGGTWYMASDNVRYDFDDETFPSFHFEGVGCYLVDENDMKPTSPKFYEWYETLDLTEVVETGLLLHGSNELSLGDGLKLYKGQTVQGGFTLGNTTSSNIVCTFKADNDAITFSSAKEVVAAGSSKDICFTFTPNTTGEFNGTITVTPAGYEPITIKVKALVEESPVDRYKEICSMGADRIEFGMGDGKTPFEVTDTLTGSPVALSTCAGDQTKSVMTAKFTVADGESGSITWKGYSWGYTSNKIEIELNGEEQYSSSDEEAFNKTVPLKPGVYELTFTYDLKTDYYRQGYTDKPLRAYISDIALNVGKTAGDNATIENPDIDFGRCYVDKFAKQDSMTVRLLNLGTNPLKVTGVTGDGIFDASIPDAEAATQAVLPVIIKYNVDKVGEYTGKVILKTTAGDFTVNCKLNTENLPADYDQIVKEGIFSFDTNADAPYMVEDGKAYNSTAGELYDSNKGHSWLEASFDVAEGETATLSWKGLSNSYDEAAGNVTVNCSEILIDGKYKQTYYGENTDASSSTFTAGDLVFGAGRHSVRFTYVKSPYDYSGTEYRLSVYDLALSIEKHTEYGVSADVNDVKFDEVKYGFSDYASITLTNEGYKPLSVLSVEADKPFGGLVPDGTVEQGGKIVVPVFFKPEEPGLFDGTITIHTTAGNVEIAVSGSAADLGGRVLLSEDFETGYKDWISASGPDDDDPDFNWVEAWQWSSSDYPIMAAHSGKVCMASIAWDVKNNKSYNPDNWLVSPEFEIPSGGAARLLFWRAAQPISEDSYEVLIGTGDDFTKYEKFYSETITDANGGEWKESEVDLSSWTGKTVRIAFRHNTADTWMLIDDVVAYTTATTDIVSPTASIAKKEYFTIDGRKVDTPQKGVNIVRETDSDGYVKTYKIVVK